MGKSRSRSRRRKRAMKRWVPLVALCASAAVVGGLVFAAMSVQPPPVEAAQTVTPTPTPEASVTPEPVPTSPTADAVALLNDNARPWTLTVVGDSTGNDGDEWVWISARELSDRHNRPVQMNTWNMTSAAYDAPKQVGDGGNAPIVIWNAAAPGAGPKYAIEHLAAMTAQVSDMLIVNHGHNFITPEGGASRIQNIVTDTAATWGNVPAVSVVVQNPRTTLGGTQNSNLAAVRAKFDGAYTLIDVEAAWAGQDIAALLRDGTHPNETGSALWSDAARSALGW